MGYIINFPNIGLAADDIASFELKPTEARVEVSLKNGKEYTFSYANPKDAQSAFNSIKAGFGHAGYDATYINP